MLRTYTKKRPKADAQPTNSLQLLKAESATKADAEGFIPLWTKDTTLRWRFRESAMKYFRSPAAAKAEIRRLLGAALLAWGDR